MLTFNVKFLMFLISKATKLGQVLIYPSQWIFYARTIHVYFRGESLICTRVFVGKDYAREYNNGMKVKHATNIGRGGGLICVIGPLNQTLSLELSYRISFKKHINVNS